MANIAYYRVSTHDQSIEAQRHSLVRESPLGQFDEEFRDEGVSGAVPAAQRQGFAQLIVKETIRYRNTSGVVILRVGGQIFRGTYVETMAKKVTLKKNR